MMQRSHPPSRPVLRRLSRLRRPRGVIEAELDLLKSWLRYRISRGIDWLLQLASPTAATVLEMQNVRRCIPEIGEIEQALRRAGAEPRGGGPSAANADPSPFAD